MKIPSLAARLTGMSLSGRIILGLVLGILAGLFLGEPAAALQPVADVYIRLMQMTVLPYLVAALIVGFGQLDPLELRRLARRGGALLLMTWVLAFAVIAVMPMTFPKMESASFFSSAIVEPPADFSIADLYFTANPFNSLANAVVPAVVLFSSMLGLGLIGNPHRERVLGVLRVLSEAVVEITRFVVGLTPIGVFAIVAVTAGTTTPDTLTRLEVYLVAFGLASLVLAFWILPTLVTAVTPFKHREVLTISRDALLTAFVANNAFIVMPMLIERSKALLEEHGLRNDDSDSASEVLVPILFNFPSAGKLLTLLFLPFAAWMAGTPFPAGNFASLFLVGVPAYFAKAQVAIPFLMDLFALPQDLFQLYIPTTILTGKFDSLVTAVNLLVFALIGGAAARGALVIERRRLVSAATSILASVVVAAGLAWLLLFATVDTTYRSAEKLFGMSVHRDMSAAIVHRPLEPVTGVVRGPETVLERVRARGTLRIGYDPDNIPFSFFNADQQLVGFDIELSVALAEALGVRPDFFPVKWSEVGARLSDGSIDVMPGIWYRPFWFRSLRLSEPYLTQTMGFAVLDQRREEFSKVDGLRRSKGLKIGVSLDADQNAASRARYFGGSDAQFVPMENANAFFDGRVPEIDAFLIPVEGAAASTLLHPQYTVVVPQPDPVKIPVAFGLPLGADNLAIEVDQWVTFAQSEGLIDRAYEQWILGKDAQSRKPRWSILRDVLGWKRD